jgi:CheY-like chemotaxis protein
MNGALTVDSVIDEGSSFRIELPAAATPTARIEVSRHEPSKDAGSAGTILYIEDNASNVGLMEMLVKRRPGVVLLHAPDGGTGVAMVRDRRPDLVFLDLHLPDCPGEEVLRQIWEDPVTREIPVAVLSADATFSQQRRLLAAGAVTYLTKPFDIAEVLRVIDEKLGRLQPVK